MERESVTWSHERVVVVTTPYQTSGQSGHQIALPSAERKNILNKAPNVTHTHTHTHTYTYSLLCLHSHALEEGKEERGVLKQHSCQQAQIGRGGRRVVLEERERERERGDS